MIYRVHTEWQGYSRGTAIWEVEADSPDEAREFYYDGDLVTRNVVRDDTESEAILAELIKGE